MGSHLGAGDGSIVGFPGCVADGELDDLVEEPPALGGRQLIAVHDRGEMAGPVGCRGQLLEMGDDVVVELSVSNMIGSSGEVTVH